MPAEEFAAVARRLVPGATVSAAVLHRESGRLLLDERPGTEYRSASLVKLLIAADVLHRRRDTPGLAGQLHAMLAASDDDVANELWDADGGPELVPRARALMELPTARPPLIPGRWGDTLLTTADVLAAYRYVLTELPAEDRDLVVAALADAPRFGADGFDQHFGVPGAMPRPWAVKQGWSTTAEDRVLHTSGLVGAGWPLVVVVLAAFPPDTPWPAARASVDAVTAAVRANPAVLRVT